jgi:hypothetical protein
MKFFDLKDYYMTNFSLKNMGNWTLEDLDNMMFWEREIYVNILAEHNKKQKNNSNEMDIGLYYG